MNILIPEFIDNVHKTLSQSIKEEIKPGSKISIAAACFSIYAYQELQHQLKNIDELRFIFTSPTFVAEKTKKEKREFYIPRLNRERSLYGTEFEVKLRNELNQKAIAKECAKWIKQKVCFKSNSTQQSMPSFINIDETINHIFDMVVKYRLTTFYIEKGWWEQTMRNFIFEEMRRRNIFFDVIPLEHAKQGSKLEWIKMLQPRFKAHSIYFPDKADFMTEFKAELAGVVRDGIKSEFIDCVDAFAMTEQVATAPYFPNEIHQHDRQRIYQSASANSLFELAGF